ncbi:MAG: GAF domain-containing protein [Patescibacteria group bacterium]|jgi:uroporphyrinogen-III synthase
MASCRHQKELILLQHITTTISYNLNLDEVLHEIVHLVSKTMRADSCLIYLTQEHSLILKASKIPHPKMINKVAMQFGEGITGWVAQQREITVISKQAYQDKRFKIVPHLDEDRFEAFISVPIIFQNNVVGVINVQNRKKRIYTPKELKLIQTIAAQVGGAISNAKLLSETVNLKQALAARKIIEKAKGLLMKQQHLSEESAYNLIRKKAMNSKKTRQEVAEAILLAFN